MATVSLTMMSGPRDGETQRFQVDTAKEKILTFGRRETCDIVLNYDSQVSRLHAQLIFDSGRFWLEDLNSRNGTFVEKERLTGKTEIQPRTLFRVGRTWMRIESRPSDETQVAEPVIDDDDLDSP